MTVQMKREFLENFKAGDQKLPKEVIDAILEENNSDIEAVKSEFADYEAVKAQLAEAGKTIEGFKGMDIDAIRKEAEDWKAKAEQAERAAAEKLAAVQFDHLLNSAITGAKGRSANAILGELGKETLATLRASKNQEADIKSALEALRQKSGYLFESTQTPPPYAAGTGTHKLLSEVTRETFGKMGYRERLELKQSDPELYHQMKESR